MPNGKSKFEMVSEIEILLSTRGIPHASTKLWEADKLTLSKIVNALRERERLKKGRDIVREDIG
jgi:hypothetical protein